ncbi:hypothetical protein LJB86_05275, partial [Deltaproteobacteria bacterium OttesenSCG-928-M10]|nr:hypothetical protein [Deltaproteobacteria bacterium OttesenSCG-928-M10]
MTRRKIVIIGSGVLVAILGLVIWWKSTGFYTVTIVNIANFQSQLEPFDNTSADGERERLGGAAHLAATVRELEKKYPSLIVTESGDLVLGLWWRMWRGEPEFRVMSRIGVQVGALGNHEFNSGLDKFKEAVVEHAAFPLLGTNIDFVYDPDLAGRIKKHVLITDRGGVKVGFFSLVPPRLTFMAKIDREVSIA